MALTRYAPADVTYTIPAVQASPHQNNHRESDYELLQFAVLLLKVHPQQRLAEPCPRHASHKAKE